MEHWLPTIVGSLITIATLLVVIGRWTKSIENRMDTIENRIKFLGTTIRGVLDFNEALVNCLSASGVLKSDDAVNLSSQHLKNYKDLILQVTLPTKNPITLEESKKLEYYLDKIERKERLTKVEFDNFYKLVQKLKRERPDQEGTWILAAIAGFLLGIYLSSEE